MGLAHPMAWLVDVPDGDTIQGPLLISSRRPSKSFLASPRTSTRALPIANEPTTPRKSAPPERPPL